MEFKNLLCIILFNARTGIGLDIPLNIKKLDLRLFNETNFEIESSSSISLIAYRRSGPMKGLNANEVTFGKNDKIVIYVHGYATEDLDDGIQIKNSLFQGTLDVNWVVILDWRTFSVPKISCLPSCWQRYKKVALENVPIVSEKLRGFLVKNLHNSNYIYAIGFSLGSHIAGTAARWAARDNNLTVDRISALDPAGIIFEFSYIIFPINTTNTVRSTDAKFVDVIHVSNDFAMNRPAGHLDIFVKQNDCNGYCEHHKAIDLYISSLIRCSLITCPRTEEYCTPTTMSDLGYLSDKYPGRGEHKLSVQTHWFGWNDKQCSKFMNAYLPAKERICNSTPGDKNPNSVLYCKNQPYLTECVLSCRLRNVCSWSPDVKIRMDGTSTENPSDESIAPVKWVGKECPKANSCKENIYYQHTGLASEEYIDEIDISTFQVYDPEIHLASETKPPIKLIAYKRTNPEVGYNATEIAFKKGEKIAIYTHGYATSNLQDGLDIKNAFFQGTLEIDWVVLTDWRLWSLPKQDSSIIWPKNYKIVALQNVPIVAAYLTNFLARKLCNDNYVYLVGFSLGGQVSGTSARTAALEHDLIANRISALDPAGPIFEYSLSGIYPINTTNTLRSSDAIFVDVLHASTVLGMVKPAGHLDTYLDENDCWRPDCRHTKAITMYISSLVRCSLITCPRYGGECSSATMSSSGYLADNYPGRGEHLLEVNTHWWSWKDDRCSRFMNAYLVAKHRICHESPEDNPNSIAECKGKPYLSECLLSCRKTSLCSWNPSVKLPSKGAHFAAIGSPVRWHNLCT